MPKSLKREPPKRQPKRRAPKHRTNPDLVRANQNNPKSLVKGPRNLGTRKSRSPQARSNVSGTLQNGMFQEHFKTAQALSLN